MLRKVESSEDLDSKRVWVGTAKELRRDIEDAVRESDRKFFPQTDKGTYTALRRIERNLAEVGVCAGY
jgi:hypothetical protein